jgi:hypothetical protein
MKDSAWPDKRCRTAWKAHLAEVLALTLAQERLRVLLAAQQRGYPHARRREAVRLLERDSSLLGEVLIELLAFADEVND